MRLWLDDERKAPPGWVWAKTAAEAIRLLGNMKGAREASPKTKATLMGYKLDAEDRWREKPILWEEFWTITEMSFDHDLADVHYDYWYIGNHPDGESLPEEVREEARRRARKEMTGYDVLLWMAEHEVWPTEACYVHTHNSAAQDKMCKTIDRYGPYTTRVRWTPYRPTAEDIAALEILEDRPE